VSPRKLAGFPACETHQLLRKRTKTKVKQDLKTRAVSAWCLLKFTRKSFNNEFGDKTNHAFLFFRRRARAA